MLAGKQLWKIIWLCVMVSLSISLSLSLPQYYCCFIGKRTWFDNCHSMSWVFVSFGNRQFLLFFLSVESLTNFKKISQCSLFACHLSAEFDYWHCPVNYLSGDLYTCCFDQLFLVSIFFCGLIFCTEILSCDHYKIFSKLFSPSYLYNNFLFISLVK